MAKSENRQPIYWKGELVGYMENPQADMFHVCGRWISTRDKQSQLIIDTLNSLQDIDADLWVGLGDPEEEYTISFPPDERNEIELVWRGYLQESGK